MITLETLLTAWCTDIDSVPFPDFLTSQTAMEQNK